jgi:hypothetical protein
LQEHQFDQGLTLTTEEVVVRDVLRGTSHLSFGEVVPGGTPSTASGTLAIPFAFCIRSS